MAPTGKAAYNLGGTTIHSALQIPASQGFHYRALSTDKLNTLQAKYRNLKVILIDEISMVGNGMFNYVNLRLQQIMGNKKLFGGVSIISSGDLFQLKPVFDGWIFQDLNVNYGPLATNLWQECFTMFELTEIMRQKDDANFAQLLNRLREGNHTDNDIKYLETRIVQLNYEDVTTKHVTDIVHIFYSNASVDSHNILAFNKLTGFKTTTEAVDTVIGDVDQAVKTKILKSVPKAAQKTMGLQHTLHIAIGQRIDLCINLSVEDGLINGASGIIRFIDILDNNNVTNLWIEFDDQSVGRKTRHDKKHLLHSGIKAQWTPIQKIPRQFKVGRYKMLKSYENNLLFVQLVQNNTPFTR
ncbi:uncharacterized protein [Ptychodera flava]|uniref:uncharacterized protein n=1 Tax=Ptychodera flava TaxID=63121 RepID=UPI00396AB0AD